LIVTNGIPVRSVNGPLVTAIVGHQVPGDITGDSAVRCVYLAYGSSVEGFTITQGATLTGGNDVEAGGDTSGAGILELGGPEQPVINCIIVSNVAGDFGGGVYGAMIYNCLVVSNTAQLGSYGGGTFQCTSVNCTITANTADIGAGDAFGYLVNCVVTGNFSGDGGNYAFDTLDYCCTTPDPGGTGNVIADPLFVNAAAGNFHLQAGSPCVNAGNNSYITTATDLAGNPRVSGGTVDVGAYELQFHYVDINSANPVAPFSSWATAATNIQDAVDAASNYDEVLVNDGVYQYGGGILPGFPPSELTNRVMVTKTITVQSANGPSVTQIKGYQVPGAMTGNSAVRCVYLADNASLIGFTLTNGATQNVEMVGYSAFDQAGGGVLCASTNELLSNCLITGNFAYGAGGGAYGGTLKNCTLAWNSAVGFSVPAGGGARDSVLANCLVISNSAYDGGGAAGGALSNCFLTGNSAWEGGGAYDSSMNGCTVSANTADLRAGGVFGSGPTGEPVSLLQNCLIISNSVLSTSGLAGGVYGGTLQNCTVALNSSQYVGGAYFCSIYNCVIYFNGVVYPDAPGSIANIDYSSTLNYCCTTPMPTNGFGNLTNDPLFVNPAGGDFHLQSNSPCINAGNNTYTATPTDLDGNPRISGGTVDIGAYEFQNPASIISYAWLEQYGLATDGSADFADTDHDGMNNYNEWLTGTDPTNPSSVLQLLSPAPSGTNIVVTWQSVNTRNYFLQRGTDLNLAPVFQTVATNIPGQSGNTSYTDSNAPAPGPYYYRVGVQTP
jgi:hypothetical protein